MGESFQRLKVEKWLKIEVIFQSILDPVEAQAKKAFVNSVERSIKAVWFEAIICKPWQIIQT